MVTPPLYKLEPGKTYSWRVMFIGDSEKLPKDRETIFVAKFRAIPPSQPDEQKGANGISLDTIQVLYFKFYYRPKAFEKLIIAEEEKKISFRRDGNEIVVKNNSPIYMTFESLNVGGVIVEYQELFKPLKPLSEQRFKVNEVIASDKVSWSVLDELILELPKQTSVLH